MTHSAIYFSPTPHLHSAHINIILLSVISVVKVVEGTFISHLFAWIAIKQPQNEIIAFYIENVGKK